MGNPTAKVQRNTLLEHFRVGLAWQNSKKMVCLHVKVLSLVAFFFKWCKQTICSLCSALTFIKNGTREKKKHGFLRFLPPIALNKEEAEAPQLKKGFENPCGAERCSIWSGRRNSASLVSLVHKSTAGVELEVSKMHSWLRRTRKENACSRGAEQHNPAIMKTAN